MVFYRSARAEYALSAPAMIREIAPEGGNFRGVCPAFPCLGVRNRAAEE